MLLFMKKLLSTFIFPVMVFLTLIGAVFAFLYLNELEPIEEFYKPTFLTRDSITLLLINIFIYLFLFTLWSLYFKGREKSKENLTMSLEEGDEQNRRYTKELYKKRWQTITEILEKKSHH